MNIEDARFNMIEQQIRPWAVLDEQVLRLLREVKREDFVPADKEAWAFVDMEIPLGNGHVMLAAKVVARALQALTIQPTDRILEIGTGSGFTTALLARMGKSVVSMDTDPAQLASAAARLAKAGIRDVSLLEGNGLAGVADGAPFDVIFVGGAVPAVPSELLAQLAPNGRLFAIVGQSPTMTATLVTKEGVHTGLFETDTAYLDGVTMPSAFVF